MQLSIQNVCVIGAGALGGGVAAHLANLGFKVSLLDVSQAKAIDGFEHTRLSKPPLFYIQERANAVRLGNLSDHLEWVAEAQWIFEAITEDLEARRSLYTSILPYLRADAIVTTASSGLTVAELCKGFNESFCRRFLGTHFYHPPRYIKLVELISGPATDPQLLNSFFEFLELAVARRVVLAKDIPGFIGDHFGVVTLLQAVRTAEKLHLSVEEVDAITGSFMGRSKLGTFRLIDKLGLDVLRDVSESLTAHYPSDTISRWLERPSSFHNLLARGWIGEKAGQGYYRTEGRELLTLDLGTLAYRQVREVSLPSIERLMPLPLEERLCAALDLRDEVGEFFRAHLLPTLKYADAIKQQVSYSVPDFDHVLQWGFRWQKGPFETIDAIGPETLNLPPGKFYRGNTARSYDGSYARVPIDAEYVSLTDFPVIDEQRSLRIRDLGDGVFAISILTKMGILTPELIADLRSLLEHQPWAHVVLTSEASSFSAGLDIGFLYPAIIESRTAELDRTLVEIAALGELIEKRQVVAAVFGHCLGGGLELALSCSHIVTLAETHIGLPESRIGLIPAARGVTLTRLNNQTSTRRLCEVAMALTEGAVSENADHARTLGYLRASDVTVYHPDRLIAVAKRMALLAKPVERPHWVTPEGPLAGIIDRSLTEAHNAGRLSEYDHTIGDKLKNIYAKSKDYQDALLRERAEFLDLSTRALTHARLKHMLENHRPLRN